MQMWCHAQAGQYMLTNLIVRLARALVAKDFSDEALNKKGLNKINKNKIIFQTFISSNTHYKSVKC